MDKQQPISYIETVYVLLDGIDLCFIVYRWSLMCSSLSVFVYHMFPNSIYIFLSNTCSMRYIPAH